MHGGVGYLISMGRLPGRVYQVSLMSMLTNMGAAYGFTLVVWGSGTLGLATYHVIHYYDVCTYVGGYYLVFLLLNVLLFKPRETNAELSKVSLPAYGFLHLLSIPLTLGMTYLICRTIHWFWLGFGLSGLLAAISYTFISALELAVALP